MSQSSVLNRARDVSKKLLEALAQEEAEMEASVINYRDYKADAEGSKEDLEMLKGMPPLPDAVGKLFKIVVELKEQLKELVKVNEAMESDLERANESLTDAARDREDLLERLRDKDIDIAAMDDLRLEVKQLGRERDALAGKVQDLGAMLSTSEQRVQETTGLLDKFRKERNDAVLEAECLNSQFARAMKLVEEQRYSLNASADLEQEQAERIARLEKQLKETVKQRDIMKTELVESRNALQEVRQSILAASRESRQAPK